MGIMWNLFRKDLKAIMAFPRFEILLFISTFTFLGMCLNSIIRLRTLMYFSQNEFAKAFNSNFSFYLSSFVFILAPLLMTEVITGEYERGTLLALISYPVKRLEVLTSKFLATFLFSSIMLLATFLCSIVVASYFNNLTVDFRMLLGYSVGMMLFSILLCSVAAVVSVFSRRLLVAAVAFVAISLCWGIAVTGLAQIMNSMEIQIYAYTETVRQLINLIMFPDGPFVLFSKEQIVTAVAVHLIISAACLGLSYWFFRQKEFK